ncbi:unnamed protein product [Acanthoscelides obtectus]|uniref:Uncharacterized protein n=1 Tax=Acanthoscelides obtectus TaxID=200917 RepID=A0A9P0NXS4_ACAOB|nr:unnamed protein product [Acanthoscelides obtectus]CAK1642941.1 hypothetical protein AOBTE_LOCUS13312 [Acanthoscelides obtectus]
MHYQKSLHKRCQSYQIYHIHRIYLPALPQICVPIHRLIVAILLYPRIQLGNAQRDHCLNILKNQSRHSSQLKIKLCVIEK